MPSCVVKWCKNNTTLQKKSQGITFHRFPTGNEPWKSDWIRIIRNCRGQEDWISSKTSVICSIHFDKNDLYTTKKGCRRVVTYAVPKLLLIKPSVEEEHPDATYSLRGVHRNHDQEQQSSSISDQLLVKPPVEEEHPDATYSLRGVHRNHDQEQQSSSISDQLWIELPVKEELPDVKSESTNSLRGVQRNHDQEQQSSSISDQLWIKLPIKEELPDGKSEAINSLRGVHRNHDQDQQSSLRSDKACTQAPPPDSDYKEPSGPCTPLSSAPVYVYTITAPLPDQTTGLEAVNCQQPLLWDSPRKVRLKEIIKRKDLLIESHRKKIKTLNQKIRRLCNRNQYLKKKLKHSKHPGLVES